FLDAIHVADHQPERARVEREADLAFAGLLSFGVEQNDTVTWQRPSHGARFQYLSGRVADHCCGLGLAETVAQGDSPGRLHLRDDFGIERFAGAEEFAYFEAAAVAGEVFL